MGIAVTCPNGHEFKVKEKYAGKKGLCPYCKGQVAIRVPKASTDDITKAAYRVAAEEHGASIAATAASSVFDDHGEVNDPSASTSLMGSSVIRHNIKCKCGESVPMWFAKCPKCGIFFERR